MTYTLMGIIIEILDEFQEDYGLVMKFWNDNICQNSVKIKIKK